MQTMIKAITTMLLLCYCNHIMAHMQQDYDQGKVLGQGGITFEQLQRPTDAFLQQNKDASHLSNMNNAALTEQGSDTYQNQSIESEAESRQKSASEVSQTIISSGQASKDKATALQTQEGNLLTLSESAKIEATNQYKITPSDNFYKDSFAVENNSLKTTGGTSLQRKSIITKESIETCEEGVEFTVEMVRQLVFIPPPRQDQQVDMTISFPNCITAVTKHWDEWRGHFRGRKRHYYTDYVANTTAINDHIANYFTPVDYATKKIHNIHQSRIKKFDFLDKVNNSSVRVRYHHDTHQSEAGAKEYWKGVTTGNEALIEQHNCYATKRQCVDAEAKHFDELIVTRPCWREQVTFTCHSEPLDGCQYYQDKGCYLQKSICIDDAIKPCAKWKRTYQCLTKSEVDASGVGGTTLFCLDGDCHSPSIDKNSDMNEAIAQLSVFKEMQKNMSNTTPPTVFKGEMAQCTRHMINFTDCCSSMGGWGKSLGLSNCSAEEKALAERKGKKLCHYVGTYCAEKMWPNICVRKKSTYCCFANKLARLFHEQGRPQLGRGWGSAEHPDCGALTAHELHNIKFDQMDFAELFHELFQQVGTKATKALPQQMQNQMPAIQQNLQKVRETGDGGVTRQVF